MPSDELRVSRSGRLTLPAAVRRRWGITNGGHVTVVDLGDALVILPSGNKQEVLGQARSAAQHLAYVQSLDDPDLATT